VLPLRPAKGYVGALPEMRHPDQFETTWSFRAVKSMWPLRQIGAQSPDMSEGFLTFGCPALVPSFQVVVLLCRGNETTRRSNVQTFERLATGPFGRPGASWWATYSHGVSSDHMASGTGFWGGRVPVRVEIEDGAFSRVLNNPGTTPDCTGGMRPWRNVPGT
jgi:hypothetical protein